MSKKYPNLAKILKKLLFDKDIKPVDLARAVDLPAPTIHRLVTGKSTRPYTSSLKPIADFFSIDMDQLVGERPMPEHRESLTSDDKIDDINESISHNIKAIPILSWNSFSDVTSTQILELGKITVGNHISDNAFALIMPDASMEPVFSYNCTLIFDPSIQHQNRSYILVKIASKAVFRQLIDDDEHKYLKPLNPNVASFPMRLLDRDDKILATLVESRNCFK